MVDGVTPVPGSSARLDIDRWALVTLVFEVPWALLSWMVVGSVGAAMGTYGFAAATALWLLSGLLLLVDPVQNALARIVHRYRSPVGEEVAQLEAAFVEVASAAGIEPGEYDVLVDEREAIAVTARGRRLVAVTRSALRRLSQPQLTALLARGLAEHLGGHPWALALATWYGAVGRLCVRVVVALFARLAGLFAALTATAVVAAPQTKEGRRIAKGLVKPSFRPFVWVCFVGLMLPLSPILVVLWLCTVLLRATDRRRVLRADGIVTEWGYGEALAGVVQHSYEPGSPMGHGGKSGVMDRLLASEPPLAKRLTVLSRGGRAG